MAERSMSPRRYTADNGKTYSHRVADYIGTQMGGGDEPLVGGTPATTADTPLPKAIKPRRALLQDPISGKARSVIVLDTAAALWTEPDATLQLLAGFPPVMTTYHKYGTEGERSRHDKRLAAAGTGA